MEDTWNSKVDLHMHSNSSDGTDSPSMLYQKVKKAGLCVFALTDHDTIGGIREMLDCIETDPYEQQPQFIPGIEFSCIDPAGKCHILGLNCDMTNPLFLQALADGKALRSRKMLNRIDFLKREYGIILPQTAVQNLLEKESAGKPHLAEELVKMGLAADMSDGIHRYLRHCDRNSITRIPASQAIEAIHAAGGIPVWAHPLGGENEKRISADAFHSLLTSLIAYGLKGIECYYSRYHREDISFLLNKADEYDLLISGGSDYHGTRKTVKLGQLCAEPLRVEPEWLSIWTKGIHHV